MWSSIHGPNVIPSPKPPIAAYSRWVWALTSPGRITEPSNRSSASGPAGPTSAIVAPLDPDRAVADGRAVHGDDPVRRQDHSGSGAGSFPCFGSTARTRK